MARKLWALSASLPLSLLGLVAGCAGETYLFEPAEQATATIEGYSAARYTIPPEAPRGDVRIASFGVHDIEQAGGEDVPAIHVRLVISNDSGAGPWSVDTRRVHMEVRGKGDIGAPLVSTDGQGLPVVDVAPGRQRVIDLFYPLPDGMEGASDVPAFDLLWVVKTDTREVAERTPFERIEFERAPRSAVSGGAEWYGPYWWYDPWYYPPAVVLHRTIIVQPSPIAPRYHVRPRVR